MASLSFSMSTSGASCPAFTFPSQIDNVDRRWSRKIQITKSGMAVPVKQYQLVQPKHRIMCSRQIRSAATIQASAMNARCAEGQTQTVQRQSSSITIAPVQGKEKSPDLDDGGSGFPPRDDGDGGGGGGGGGGGWSGGFFFFGLLAFLGFLKDKESEGPYQDSRRR